MKIVISKEKNLKRSATLEVGVHKYHIAAITKKTYTGGGNYYSVDFSADGHGTSQKIYDTLSGVRMGIKYSIAQAAINNRESLSL